MECTKVNCPMQAGTKTDNCGKNCPWKTTTKTGDLILMAAALERMKSMAGCATCDNYNYVRCRACSWNDAMNIVEEMSTVDAIPVEWILNKVGDEETYTLKYRHAWGQLVGLWAKEQEAR